SALSNEDCAKTAAAPVMELKKPAAAASGEEKGMFERGRATINIKFDTNKAVVKPIYHEELKKFADVLKKNPEINLKIEGHTDDVGKDEANMKLSQMRAESVRAYLIEKFDIAADRLTAKGYGESRPVYDNRVAIGREKNRRVEAAVSYRVKK
ncbi:MAG: OmpA family protein, partial [Deltaproteobacteria bacterium]|nr:OmpA family protein [Deltaproteobacteria bacterium]